MDDSVEDGHNTSLDVSLSAYLSKQTDHSGVKVSKYVVAYL